MAEKGRELVYERVSDDDADNKLEEALGQLICTKRESADGTRGSTTVCEYRVQVGGFILII